MDEGNLIQLQNNNIINQQQNEPNPVQLSRPDPENQLNNPNQALTLLKQLADHEISSLQDKTIKDRLVVAAMIMEKYYGKKASELYPTGDRATKRQKQRLEEMEDDCLSLEINKRSSKEKGGALDPEFETEQRRLAVSALRASATAPHAMAVEDYKSATMWTLHAHHIARIIAGEYQVRKETALAFVQFKDILSVEISALDVFGDESKKKIKNIAKTQKILADQEKQIPQAAPTTPIVQSITQTPSQQQQPASSAQVQTSIFRQPYFQQFPLQQFSSVYQPPSNQFVSFQPQLIQFLSLWSSIETQLTRRISKLEFTTTTVLATELVHNLIATSTTSDLQLNREICSSKKNIE
ncbi:MAG: hypothetical protein EZS28_012958 [Streblomastix strix]|uniref:Uncharacterized protein n=1 Tax=Streblomastix strix TaxID=222440 RepID=A0A5J4W9C3_9EUKA|nr:MAG: hypothetical protein EZS28_012958 [Streblomastix strix]